VTYITYEHRVNPSGGRTRLAIEKDLHSLLTATITYLLKKLATAHKYFTRKLTFVVNENFPVCKDIAYKPVNVWTQRLRSVDHMLTK